MNGTIQNRDAFLSQIANRLGRERKTSLERPKWKYNPQDEVLKDATQDDLVEVLKQQCNNIHTKFVQTNSANLVASLKEVVDGYGGGSIVVGNDKRFEQFGLSELLKKDWPESGSEVHVWDHTLGRENIEKANLANVGISISEITLAESATAVLFSSKDQGRTISFLPNYSIIIMPKSTIVPRMTQGARFVREKVKNGEQIASCVNFISGPSDSADIEMIPVIGVHGPIKMTYIVVDDL
ncbi:LutC/YkgG family protein [Robertmurraya andreesenii]|uniref:Lactate utilization protein C n=1 Tax=Anoxybacillus andreesenii TaxID=1325932 RepID=A0ABT9UZF7_9BACL|nr:lactate utilization protein C [Robertmurraya andreesenii]MDQ0154086.1 L-lactate dehydrogenase complex protein LldG [Robertmurraya andreesenii]